MPAPGAFVSKFLVEHLYFGVMRFGRSHEVSPPTAPQPHPLGRDEDRGGAAAVGISKSSVAELGRIHGQTHMWGVATTPSCYYLLTSTLNTPLPGGWRIFN